LLLLLVALLAAMLLASRHLLSRKGA
jgi:hypothetical protein